MWWETTSATHLPRWLLWSESEAFSLGLLNAYRRCRVSVFGAFYICGNPGLCSPGQHLTSIALQRRTPSVSGRGQSRAEPDWGSQALEEYSYQDSTFSPAERCWHGVLPLSRDSFRFTNCILHASAELWKAFLRDGSSPWNRTQKLEPLATVATRSTWIAMPCKKWTAKSCCHRYATHTFQLTKGTDSWLACWPTTQLLKGWVGGSWDQHPQIEPFPSGWHRCMSALLTALPAASTACKTTAWPEFAPPGPDAQGQPLSAQMIDSEQRLSSSLNHGAALFMRTWVQPVLWFTVQSSPSAIERNTYQVPVNRRLSIELTNRPGRLRDQPKHSEHIASRVTKVQLVSSWADWRVGLQNTISCNALLVSLRAGSGLSRQLRPWSTIRCNSTWLYGLADHRAVTLQLQVVAYAYNGYHTAT